MRPLEVQEAGVAGAHPARGSGDRGWSRRFDRSSRVPAGVGLDRPNWAGPASGSCPPRRRAAQQAGHPAGQGAAQPGKMPDTRHRRSPHASPRHPRLPGAGTSGGRSSRSRDRGPSLYAAAQALANRIANALIADGLALGDRVAFLARTRPSPCSATTAREGRGRSGAAQLSPGAARMGVHRRRCAGEADPPGRLPGDIDRCARSWPGVKHWRVFGRRGRAGSASRTGSRARPTALRAASRERRRRLPDVHQRHDRPPEGRRDHAARGDVERHQFLSPSGMTASAS